MVVFVRRTVNDLKVVVMFLILVVLDTVEVVK